MPHLYLRLVIIRLTPQHMEKCRGFEIAFAALEGSSTLDSRGLDRERGNIKRPALDHSFEFDRKKSLKHKCKLDLSLGVGHTPKKYGVVHK